MQIDRQGIDALAARRFDAVLIGHESLEAVHIIPDFPVVGVEDMGTVNVDHDAGLAVTLCMAIAGDMVAGIDDLDCMARQCEFSSYDRSRKAGAYDDDFSSARIENQSCLYDAP